MTKRWLSIGLIIGAFFFGVASKNASTTLSLPQPAVIIAKVNHHNVTEAIPPTKMFTPGTTGVFRVTCYMLQTTLGSTAGSYYGARLGMNWIDDAGAETSECGLLSYYTVPPYAIAGSYPVTFRAIAGQPVTYYVSNVQPLQVFDIIISRRH